MDDQLPRAEDDVPSKKFWEKTKGGVPDAVAQTIVGGIFALLVIAGTWGKDRIVDWLHAKHNNSPKVLQTTAVRDRDVHNILVELRTTWKADRALIRQFHNGDHWSNGTPIRKLSTSHEADRLGVSSVFDLVRALPTSQVPDLLSWITAGGKTASVSALPAGGFKDLLTVQGVERCMIWPLYTTGTSDQLIGVLEIHWLTDASQLIDVPDMEKAASRIEFLLSRST